MTMWIDKIKTLLQHVLGREGTVKYCFPKSFLIIKSSSKNYIFFKFNLKDMYLFIFFEGKKDECLVTQARLSKTNFYLQMQTEILNWLVLQINSLF